MRSPVMYCVHIVFSCMDLPVVFINGSMMLIVLGVVGVSLVMGRFLVIEYAPWVGAHSEAVAAMLNLELTIIEGTVDMVYVGVQVIFDVISLLAGHKPHMHLPTWHSNLIDPSEVVAWLDTQGCEAFQAVAPAPSSGETMPHEYDACKK